MARREHTVDSKSSVETLSVTDGVVQIAFDLAGSNAEYIIISMPQAGSAAENEFYGHDHYVEVKDQLFGRYGGVGSIVLGADDRLEVSLLEAVPEVGSTLRIKTDMPMSDAIIAELRRLQSTLPNLR